jgi:nucleotide-binding universal stress UspA family protein
MQYAGIVGTLVTASQQAWMLVVGSRGLDAVEEHVLGSVSTRLETCPASSDLARPRITRS